MPILISQDSRALQLVAASGQSLAASAATSPAPTAAGFSIACWVRFDTVAADQILISKWSESGQRDYQLFLAGTGGGGLPEVAFSVSDQTAIGTVASTVTLSANTWYFIVCGYDPTAIPGFELFLEVNRGVADFAAWNRNDSFWGGAVPFNPDPTLPVRIGANRDSGGNISGFLNGRLCLAGIYGKTLSVTERTALYNGGKGLLFSQLGGTAGTLKTGLLAWWDLKETTGTRQDSVGSAHLAPTGSPGWNVAPYDAVTFLARAITPGVGGRAAQFVASKTLSLSIASNATLQPGNADFSLAVWFNLDNLPTAAAGSGTLIAKYATTGNQRAYLLSVSTAGALTFNLSSDGTAGNTTTVTHGTTLVPGTWYLATVTYVAATGLISLALNAGMPVTGTRTGGPFASTAALTLGYRITDATGGLDGRLGRAALWTRALSQQDQIDLFKTGLGLHYEELTAGHKVSLVSWWPLSEAGGIRYDQHTGGNDLTEAAGLQVGWNVGVYGAGPRVISRGNRGARLQVGSAQYLSVADNPSLSVAGGSFSACCWVKMASKGPLSRAIMGKYAGAGNREWTLQHTMPNDRFQFVVADGTNPINQPLGTNASAPQVGEWHFIAVTWSGTQALIYVDNGVPVAGNTPGTVPDTAANFFVGAENGSITFDGTLDMPAFWKGKVLSAAEVKALYNGGAGLHFGDLASTLGGSLLVGLQGWWGFNEYTGARVDSSGKGNDLAETNGPIFAGGAEATGGNRPFVGNGDRAVRFNGSTQYLSAVDSATLSTGDIDCSFAGWVYLENLAQTQPLISKQGNVGNREYKLSFTTNGAPQFTVWYDGTNSVSVTGNSGLVPAGNWCFVAAWHDSVGNTLNIQVNNGAVFTQAHALGIFDSTADVQIGAASASGQFVQGRESRLGFWKKVLSTAEITRLYNAGLGLRYRDIASTDSLLTSLSAYWNLDEAGGQRLDSMGTSHLTENGGGISWAKGVSDAIAPAALNGDRAAQFNGTTQSLAIADNPSLSMGAGMRLTIAAWVYLDTKVGNSGAQTILAKGDSFSAGGEYVLEYSPSSDLFRFRLRRADDTANNTVTASGFGAVPERRWHFVVAIYDGTQMTLRVNDGAPGVSGFTFDILDGANTFRIGGQNAVQPLFGRVKNVGIWKRVLSSAELTALFAAGRGLLYRQLTENGISLTSLVGYWNLDEVNGSRADSSGNGNHLAENNGPIVSAMPVWGGRRPALSNGDRSARFTGATALGIAHNTDLALGDIDLTVACWIYLESPSPSNVGGLDQTFVSKYDATGNARGFLLWKPGGNIQFRFQAHPDGTSTATNVDVTPPAPLERGWHLLVAWHDSVNNQIGLRIDDVVQTTAAHTTGLFNNTTVRTIVGAHDAAGLLSRNLLGRIDRAARWNKVLTAAEMTRLWNSGLPSHYADLVTAGDSLITGLKAWWGMNELAGTRFDAHGANHLLDLGGVTWAPSVDGSS
jgi:hypothetical protein